METINLANIFQILSGSLTPDVAASQLTPIDVLRKNIQRSPYMSYTIKKKRKRGKEKAERDEI